MAYVIQTTQATAITHSLSLSFSLSLSLSHTQTHTHKDTYPHTYTKTHTHTHTHAHTHTEALLPLPDHPGDGHQLHTQRHTQHDGQGHDDGQHPRTNAGNEPQNAADSIQKEGNAHIDGTADSWV